MNNTKTIVYTIVLAFIFSACADKQPAQTSHGKDSASWQQFKAKKALDGMD